MCDMSKKKIFAISDIHGFYDEMRNALAEAGFRENDPEHLLVCCGDYFDRGTKPREVMAYLTTIENKILIKGNHETLLQDCCNKGEYFLHDISNGTVDTIFKIGGKSVPFNVACFHTDVKISSFHKQMVNYFETKNYIFVHSWIPTDHRKSFKENWRDAHQKDWDDAMWGNPFDMAKNGLNQTGKTIVFGHWHCSTGWAREKGLSEFKEDACFDIYRGENYIAIDGCTAHTGKCNVLVIEEEELL